MQVIKYLLNYIQESRFTRRYNRALSEDAIASQCYFISASFLFALFISNSAVIYYATVLEHTQNSLALDIIQKTLISPPPETLYLKNGVFQYTRYIEDLEEIKLYLKHRQISSSINLIERGGGMETWFPTPKLLKPIDKLIAGKPHYQLITKLISAGVLITLTGVTINSVREVKTIYEKLLSPILTNPDKAKRLQQCLTLYLETNNIKNIGELLVKPKLWGDLYSQLLFVSGDLVGLAKNIDYYRFFSYLTYFSGLNVNGVIGLGFLTLNIIFISCLGAIVLLPVGAAALPVIGSSVVALTFYYFTTLDWAFLGSIINSLPDIKGIIIYLNLLIKKYIEQAHLGIQALNNIIDVKAIDCPDPVLPPYTHVDPVLPPYTQADPVLPPYTQADPVLPPYTQADPALLPYPDTKSFE